MEKLKLAVLMGGSSVERAVSFKSAENMLNALDKNKYDIKAIELPLDKANTEWVQKLIDFRPQMVLSALHGGKGENGAVQGLLRCLDIPYVGSKMFSSAVCMNKQAAKELMDYHHIPVVSGVYIPREDDINAYEQKLALLEYPLIVKPNRGGSSIGISIVNDFAETKAAIENIREKYDDNAVIERYIDGREVTCAVLQTKDGLKVLSVLDINKPSGIFDYEAKYVTKQNAASFTTLPDYMRMMIEDIALKTFKVLKCSGYGCVDMIVQNEQIYVIEVNTLPGMTERSLIPLAAGESGTLGEFLDTLINFEVERHT
ncbi:MAG: D-alanine--D-alanine ligase [Firmicutes bacterium]|nr:D-alanine--D-alanine ligase [Bacillota bacterium]